MAEKPPLDGQEARTAFVRLDPELRALHRQSRAARPAASPAEGAPEPELEPAAEAAPVSAEAAPEGPVAELRLRRDGGRPHRFRGSLIVEGAVESWLGSGARVRQSLSVWRDADGEAVLRIVQETPDAPALRPLHRLTSSPSAVALGNAVAAHDPIDGFADLPFQSAGVLAEARAEADRLRGDFLNLARMVLGALPHGRKKDEDASR
jgi:hypothetical protein